MQDRIAVRQSDMFSAVKAKQAASLPKQYDVILTNPPYVKSSDMASLPDEYKHEPKMALDGGSDGLKFIDVILKEAYVHLLENPVLFLLRTYFFFLIVLVAMFVCICPHSGSPETKWNSHRRSGWPTGRY